MEQSAENAERLDGRAEASDSPAEESGAEALRPVESREETVAAGEPEGSAGREAERASEEGEPARDAKPADDGQISAAAAAGGLPGAASGHGADEVLSVAEYARRTGVSPAAVYKRLDGTLKPYVVLRGGKKFLLAEALPESARPQRKESAPEAEPAPAPAPSAGELETLNRMIDLLREQLAGKDELIRSQSRQIDRLTEALETTAQSLARAQALHAGSLELQKLSAAQPAEQETVDAEVSREEDETGEETRSAASGPETAGDTPRTTGAGKDAPAEDSGSGAKSEGEKKGFFARLFGRR